MLPTSFLSIEETTYNLLALQKFIVTSFSTHVLVVGLGFTRASNEIKCKNVFLVFSDY